MIRQLPEYYRKSKTVADVYSVIQMLIDKFAGELADEDMRLFITTTDSFPLHEKDVGLTAIDTDDETKRARVISRLQGNNLLTKAELKQLVEIYDKTSCTVIEDFAHYTVKVIFSGHKGEPYNLDQIKAAIEEVKPAHLSFEYEFLSNTWGECRSKLGTWGNCAAYTWYGGIFYYNGRI